MVRCLTREIKDEILSFERFINGQTIVIDRSTGRMLSWRAKDKTTYKEYVSNLKTYSAIKVEGLEENKKLTNHFKKYKIKDIHLFYSPKTSYSFGWHSDTVNVVLYVLAGKKRLHIRNKTYTLGPGEFAVIPKNNMHRVFNYKNTWALSIGIT